MSTRLRWSFAVAAGFVLLIAGGLGFAYVRIATKPLEIPGLNERIAEGIAGRIGPGWTVALERSAIELDESGGLALRATGLDIRNPQGIVVVKTPQAVVGVDPFSLLLGSVQPRSIEFRDLQLRASLNHDGSISFAASPEVDATVNPKGAGPVGVPGTSAPPSPVSAAIASIVDLLIEPSGVVGALDRANLTNARLTLVGEDGRERAVFSRMDARFERAAAGARRFDMRLDGPNGPWRVGGTLRDEAAENRREAVFTLTDVPVSDVLLFSGLSQVLAETDLKLSGRAEALIVGDRIARLETRGSTSSGFVRLNDKDFSPIPVDGTSIEASWQETRRVLEIRRAAFEAGVSKVTLHGALTLPPADAPGWQLDLAGEDAQLNGAAARDPPVRIKSIETRLSGGPNGGVLIDRLALSGPMLSASLDGSIATEADRGGLTIRLKGSETGARTALRLWPEGVAKNVRSFLLDNLPGGVASVSVAFAVSGPELTAANGGGSLPDGALRIDFAVREGQLTVSDGMPPLAHASVEGVITGLTTRIRQTTGEVSLPEGRSLAMSGGSFNATLAKPGQPLAHVGFRLSGGADALVILLQNPAIRSIAGVDLNPALVKGRADLKVEFPLPLRDPPAVKDLALTIAGTTSDLTIEKAFGRERLEGGNLAISYDKGGLQIRGDARLAGAPATIEVRQPTGAAGEAVVSVVLDEAARAKKGLSFGSQLAGPVPLRVVMPLASANSRSAKSGVRVEADLGKAAIDNLIPGWTKAAGKPGKLSFIIQDGTEVRDIVLESGSVAVRGSAGFSPEGVLERADLTTFKLSPGDEMRAQAERSGGGYKIAVRGNVADARPFLRGITGPPGHGAGAASREHASREIDLDLAVNILTGFNDEALTNATVKASLQGKDVRQLNVQGRFRSAPVAARMVRRERGPPAITVQSDDAGATLRFLDVYRRMIGGQLAFTATMGEGPQTGTVTIDSFGLRNEPALRSIAQQSQAALPGDRSTGSLPRFDSNEVGFTKLKANLTRSGTRVDFSEAVIWGMQVGFTLGGWVDVARDRTDITGTFVPAYGLNNVFAQVPLFGPLLGGGKNEGLFAITFRVSGLLSAPTLTVNPLSAVAPGFLRKIFGVIPGSGGEASGTVMPPLPER